MSLLAGLLVHLSSMRNNCLSDCFLKNVHWLWKSQTDLNNLFLHFSPPPSSCMGVHSSIFWDMLKNYKSFDKPNPHFYALNSERKKKEKERKGKEKETKENHML